MLLMLLAKIQYGTRTCWGVVTGRNGEAKTNELKARMRIANVQMTLVCFGESTRLIQGIDMVMMR